MMPYLQPYGAIPVIADVIDDGVLELWRELSIVKSVKQFLINLRYLYGNYIFEKKYFSPRYVSAAFFTSEIDAATFKRVSPKTKTVVIQNGVDTAYFHPQSGTQEENSIIFEGNMSFTPNVDGAIYFCKEILPLIQKKIANVKFYIVGKNPLKEIEELASDNVVVTGFVEDVRVYLNKATVFVCPLRKGGGIKNKVLQAWSMGKASVVSSFSVGGLNAVDGENVLIRDNKGEFANAVVELLKDPDKRRKMGIAARMAVEQHYSWDTKSRELYALMQESIRKRNND
jgi:glycosyltransferase involved in cell wall biosynthesis